MTQEQYFEKTDLAICHMLAKGDQKSLDRFVPVVEQLLDNNPLMAVLIAEEKQWGSGLIQEMIEVFKIPRWT